jgi:hypothetical protein
MRFEPRTKARALLVLCLILFLSGLTVTAVLSVGAGTDTAWNGHYTLLVSSTVSPARVVNALRAEGIDNVISEASATVEIQAYDGMDRVRVNQLGERLDELDPRYDPYLRRLRSLFHVTDGSNAYGVYYLPTEHGVLSTHRAARTALSAVTDQWTMLEWHVGRSVVFLLLFLGAAVYLGVALRRVRLFTAFAVPAWACLVVAGGAMALLLAIGTLFAFALWLSGALERLHYTGFYKRSDDYAVGRRLATVYVVTWVVVGVALFAVERPQQLWILLAVIAETALVGLGAHLWTYLRTNGADHRLFIPVPIRPAGPQANRGVSGRASVVLAGVSIAAVVFGVFGGLRGAPAIPQPLGSGAADFTFTSLEEVWSQGGRVPTLADYVAHRAYHEGMMYGREYGLPEPGEEITLSSYDTVDGKLTRSDRLVLSYDDEWLTGVVNGIDPGNVAALFVKHGGPVGVEMHSNPSLHSSLSHLIQNSTLFFLVLMPFLVSRGYLRPRARQGGVSYVALRAQRQGA